MTIRSRAADDSGNLETPGTGIAVTLPVAPTSIAVTPANPSISPGGTQQFTATGTYSDSSTQNLTSQVAWASSNTVVATISAGGIATGVAAGTTTISATLSGVSGSTSLTVAAPLSITTTSLAGGKIGVAYSATVAATGGVTPYNWSVSAGTLPAGLTLASTGAITGTPTASGTSSFTVQVTDAGGRTATRNLSIVIASLNSIAVTPANPTIQAGATQQFTATGTYSDGGTRNPTSSVVWASSNTSAVTLTTGGLATAITGSANISATLFGVTGSTTLTVQSAPSAVADRFLFQANVLRTANVAGPLGLGVLANDTYAAALPLTAVAVTNPLPTGVTMDSTGVVTINRPNSTSFRYRASDGTLLSLPTTGALVNLTVNSAPTTAADNCTYVRVANGGNGSITAGTACVMTATPRTFTMNLISNDTDPNTTTNVPTDGVGDAVIGTIITASGTGVAVSASACQAAIVKTASRATITNNCDGTLTVTVAAAAPASPISLTYRALDDLGAQSGTRTNTVTVQ